MNIQINSYSYGNYGNQYEDEEPEPSRPQITVEVQYTTSSNQDDIHENPPGECPDWECKIL